MNNAFDAKILHPTTIYISMASVDIRGAWGMLWFVHKWGETANFILHFFAVPHTNTSLFAYFQCLGNFKQCKWPLCVLDEVVLLGSKR